MISVSHLDLDVTTWALGQLVLTPPQGFYRTINVEVKTTTTESSNRHQASTAGSIVVTVQAVNDVIAVADRRIFLDEDCSVVLAPALCDADGDLLTLVCLRVLA